MLCARHITSWISVGNVLPKEIGLAKLYVLSLLTHHTVQHFLVSWVFQLTVTASKLKKNTAYILYPLNGKFRSFVIHC